LKTSGGKKKKRDRDKCIQGSHSCRDSSASHNVDKYLDREEKEKKNGSDFVFTS